MEENNVIIEEELDEEILDENYEYKKVGNAKIKVLKSEKTHNNDVVKEISQLDRIENMLVKKEEEIKNEAIDQYTIELVEGGLI